PGARPGDRHAVADPHGRPGGVRAGARLGHRRRRRGPAPAARRPRGRHPPHGDRSAPPPPLSTEAGRALWEGIAEACDDGAVLELVVDPRPGGNLGPELEMMLETWRRLGHSDADAAGVAVIAHTGASHDLHSGRVDPSAQPERSTLLDEAALEALLRIAPAWAERLAPCAGPPTEHDPSRSPALAARSVQYHGQRVPRLGTTAPAGRTDLQ